MKILAISDQESKWLWDYFKKEHLEGVDLILSAGDLKPQYLSFLATFTTAPVLYVHGNHDERYEKTPPEGCICIDDDIYVHEGVRILGLGGSMWYRPGLYQYSEKQMKKRVKRLRWKLLRHRGFDILLTHSPAKGVNDGEDIAHKGFEVFHVLLKKYKPRFFIHGHIHMDYGREAKRYDRYENTHVINAHEKCIFEYEDEQLEKHIR